MRKADFLIAAVCLLLIATNAAAAPRQRLLMDDGWRFKLGDPSDLVAADFAYPEVRDLAKANLDDMAVEAKLAKHRKDPVATHLGEKVSWVQPTFDDSPWRQLNLPHDWAVELPFEKLPDDSHGYKALTATENNIGWYRKSFDLPADDKGQSLSIDFDGVYRNCVVWLNGHCLGRNVSGYIGFSRDISTVANYGGKNELVVRVDASREEGWFYEGAGIYRHVWLNVLPAVYLDRHQSFITIDREKDGTWVDLEQTVVNKTDRAVMAVIGDRMFDPGADYSHFGILPGIEVQIALPPHSSKIAHLPARDLAKRLWTLDDPCLNDMNISLISTVSEPDHLALKYGIRTIKFDPDKGFFLNGKHIFIKGTCNHQDFAGVGTALPDRLQYYRLERLKEMGCNAIRTTHGAPTPELLDAADKLGMLVLDEHREAGQTPEILAQLRRMVLRDRNHPSIIMWSICNEEDRIEGNDQVGIDIARKMMATIRALDPTRPITAAMDKDWGTGFSRVLDVEGFNYPLNTWPMGYHLKHPRQPCIATEEGSTISDRGIYENDNVKGYVSAYDVNAPYWATTAERWWNYYQTKAPFMAGAFVWTGFDYRGEPTRLDRATDHHNWPNISSHFGILDTCGFPKDNFYYYQSIWTDKPMVHLLPHWNWAGKEGKPIDVWAYSNCDQLELIVNGKSRGKQDFPKGKHLEWKIPYEPGSLIAHGYRDGKEVATDDVETTGAPAKVVLTPDRPTINADGEDVVLLKVAIADDHGRTVPTAKNLVKFAVDGDAKIIGVGNGDPSCHEPDKAEQRSVFNGLCMAIIQAGKTAGDIKITATADGLQPGSVIVKAAPATPRAGI